MSKPELFVETDPELPLALLDQKEVPKFHCSFFMIHENGDSLIISLSHVTRLGKSFCL